jgi:uncharacterized membrane protein
VTWYDFLLFAHFSFAAIWVGGGAVVQFFGLRTLASGSAERLVQFAQDVQWIGNRVLTLAALGAFLSGVGLVLNASFWGFGDDWIVIGLGLFAVTFLAGVGFFGPEAGRIAKAIETQGPESPEVLARIKRILVLSRIDLVILFLILFDMAVKPSFEDGWTIVGALVVAAAVAALLVLPARRAASRTAAA